MRKWIAVLGVVVVAVVVVAVVVFRPAVRTESYCNYVRGEESCACYNRCIYSSATGDVDFRPDPDKPYCPRVRALPVFYSYIPTEMPKAEYRDDKFYASKDPCKNPWAVIDAERDKITQHFQALDKAAKP